VSRKKLSGIALPVGLRGIEVIQCVQDMQHTVPLIAGKTTLVRIYLDPASFDSAATVSAEIAWSKGGGETYLPSMNKVRMDPARPLPLAAQRADIERSLNFRLPAEAVDAASLDIRLTRIMIPGAGDLAIGSPASLQVQFQTAPPLRIRVIGLRYNSPGGPLSPAAIHFSYMRSYLERAYPVARVEWSHIVVDADFSAPFDDTTVDLANAQIAALRAQEVSSGIDARTHYYGLVDDGNREHFMRGKAFAIPSSAQPDVVASGPAGVPRGLAGDTDASYADWYGAHELAHALGRYHPGFPVGQQGDDDPTFPYDHGFISTPDERYVGMDVGDAALGLPMLALPGLVYHDVMTYAANQWLSAYTYSGIFNRLVSEDQLGP
jgi:hypothetical protein